ncbi:MAG: NAD(P)/FAD-dependent oxidoreductase [bacterium]|nr:NAD(P)/FAD-dependent oxidoreductase [bacterium]
MQNDLPTDTNRRHHVVIIGGGFGGLNAVRALKRADVDVTLIDRRNFHLFQPLLYQVATGGLSPADVASPLRSILKNQKNVTILLGEVTTVDINNRIVELADKETIPYDSLIIGAGVRHHYFGHEEWSQAAPGLKSIEDALDIRTRIFLAFETAERETDPVVRCEWMTFVLAGGGPTGVELAGALAEIANETLSKDFRRINPRDAKIILVEGNDRVLTSYPETLSAKARRSLERLGVDVRTSTLVTKVDDRGVEIKHGEQITRINARTVLWAAGVRATFDSEALVGGNRSLLDKAGRILVDPHLNIPGHEDIYVIGDLASFTHQTGEPLPGVAAVAMQQGTYASKAVVARLQGEQLRPFHYSFPGDMATIGRNAAVADIKGFRFSGMFAWLMWVFLHLMKLVEFDNRLLVFVQWLWYYVTHNRGARLITGEHRMPNGH